MLRRRSGSADTGTLVPWCPEGFCILGLWSLKTLSLRIPALTFVILSLFVLCVAEVFLFLLKLTMDKLLYVRSWVYIVYPVF